MFLQTFVLIGSTVAEICWFPIWRPSAILNFRNLQIFSLYAGYDGNLHVCSKILSQSVERLRRYRHFLICAVYNGNLHVPAKFCLDRFNVSGDIAIFLFPIWRPSAIWIFAICKFLLSARFTMVNCMFLQNFVSIGETVAEVSPLFGFQ